MEVEPEEPCSTSTLTYEEKRKALFESLSSAENCIKGTILEQKNTVVRIPAIVKSTVTKVNISPKFQGRNQESIFKRPEAPLAKCLKPRTTPDYQVCRLRLNVIDLV